MIQVRVRLFAACREKANTDEVILTLPEKTTTAQVWNFLLDQYPDLAPYRNISKLAVNMAYVQGDLSLQNDDEVCIIPPVSGG